MIGESKGIDGAFRIQLVNDAREMIGEEPFLGSDDEIIRAFRYKVCELLIQNDESYEFTLQKMIELERIEFLAELDREKEAQQRASAIQDSLMQLEKEKMLKIEQARLRKEQEKEVAFNKAIDEYFLSNPTPPKLLEMTSGYSSTALSGYLSISYSCGQVSSFSHYLEIELSNPAYVIKAYNRMGMCYDDKASMTLDSEDIDFDYLISVYEKRKKLDEMVKSVTLRLTGRVSPRLRYIKPEGATTFSKDYSYTLYESVED